MIYVVRHGQTDWNLAGRYQGQQDIDINKTGISQALEVKEQLRSVSFDAVYSSPLIRAVHTARIIYSGTIIVDHRLIERYNGDLEGRLKKECIGMIDFADPYDVRHHVEPLHCFRERINSFFAEIMDRHKTGNVLVVTHAGVSIYANCFFNGEPDDGDYSTLKIKNCNVSSFQNQAWE